jgi:ribosomal protein L29
MTIKELREKSITELQKLLAEQRIELASMRAKVATNQEHKVRKLRQLKHTIAKILTVLNETRHD